MVLNTTLVAHFIHNPQSHFIHNPQSNGEAERAVRTVKSLWKKEKDTFLACLIYRATPLEIGYSPAELLMCRRLRTTLPLAQEQRVPKLPDPIVLSNKNDQDKGRQRKNFDADHGVKMLPTLHPRDRSTILCGGDTRWEIQT